MVVVGGDDDAGHDRGGDADAHPSSRNVLIGAAMTALASTDLAPRRGSGLDDLLALILAHPAPPHTMLKSGNDIGGQEGWWRLRTAPGI